VGLPWDVVNSAAKGFFSAWIAGMGKTAGLYPSYLQSFLNFWYDSSINLRKLIERRPHGQKRESRH
jgi:hypothetical protein